MKCQAKHIVIVLMLLLVPIYLISCSGNSTTSLPSDKIAAAAKNPPGVPTNLTARGADSHVDLKWTPPTGENIATSYNLYWSLTSGGVTTASNKILNVSMPFAHMELMNGKTYYYRVSGVNVNGEGSLSIGEVQATPMLPFTKILTKLTDPDAEEWDEFGWSVAIDGDYAVVGAGLSEVKDSNNNEVLEDAGAAYVFHRTNGVWDNRPEAVARLTAPDAQAYDHFGCAVAINGDYIIVGAEGEDGGPGDPMTDAGAAYIYHRNTMTGENTWTATGVKIVARYPSIMGTFGRSVSINGNYAIVGQEGQNRAYVFQRIGATPGDNVWDERAAMLEAPNSTKGFGISVAISGDYAIVGAWWEDGGTDNSLTQSGAAYIFNRTDANAWGKVSKVMPHDGEALDWFGYAVAISGDYAVVSAPQKDNSKGAVYAFHRLDDNFWDEGPKIVAPDAQVGDIFGWSVGISDQYVIVGAYFEDCGWDENEGEGAAYVFKRIGANTWDTGTKVTIPQGDVQDQFGYAVAIDGESAIVSAPMDDCNESNEVSGAGAVYMF